MIVLPVLLFFQAAQAPPPDVVTRAHLDHGGGVEFHAFVTPDTVYVGQQATYELGVFLDPETRSRLRRNPEFIPPESQAMLSYDLPDVGSSISVNRDGRSYEVHVFRRALFPLTAGRYVIPAARLAYTLPESQSFFSHEESFTLHSEAVTLVAIDPPSAGRPAEWAGAVGVWRVLARVDSVRDRAGDPFVLTLRVEGTGNVTLLPRPALAIPWATVVPADERATPDSTPTTLRGSKEFIWLVTPRVSGLQRIPPIRFSYFNPFARRFEQSQSEPIAVQVSPGDVIAGDTAPAPPSPERPLTLRAAMGDETPAPLGDQLFVRILLLVAPFPAFFAWMGRRPRRVRPAVTPIERLRAMAGASQLHATAADVRAAFLAGLRTRTGLDAVSLTRRGAWTLALRLEGVPDQTAGEVESLIGALDAAAFGAAPGSGASYAPRAADLLARVDREARRARAPRRPAARAASGASVVILCLAAGTGALFARDLERAEQSFAAGVAAYAGGDYVRASRLFADAARGAPRGAAAWANFGTASWAAADTVDAVVGWQRALRLDPTADDVRERLARVRTPEDTGVARVPAIPARAPAAIALLLWLGGWTAVARLAWRRRPAARVAIATLVVAGSALAGAHQFENRLEGRDLAVVMDPTPLRVLPALGAEGTAEPLPGEVVRVTRRDGVWTRVALDGGRDGWIATERLAPLGN